jgi:hypothetical protein
MAGFACKHIAATPATWGHAIDVPLFDLYELSSSAQAEVILLPGANMSTQGPMLLPPIASPDLKIERLSFLSVEPTVIAEGEFAGESLQASVPVLPAAATTTIPFFTALSTASFHASPCLEEPRLILNTAGISTFEMA